MLSPFLGLGYWIAIQLTSSQLRYLLWERVKEMLHHCFPEVGRAWQGVSVEFELGIEGEFFDRP